MNKVLAEEVFGALLLFVHYIKINREQGTFLTFLRKQLQTYVANNATGPRECIWLKKAQGDSIMGQQIIMETEQYSMAVLGGEKILLVDEAI